MTAARTAERIGRGVIERFRHDMMNAPMIATQPERLAALTDPRPPTHDTRPPAERVRAPRDAPPPPPLVPPTPGTRDRAAARVVARWMVAADHKFRWRGLRAGLSMGD